MMSDNRKSLFRDRIRRRHPPVVLSKPSILMQRRSSIDTARSIGYLIHSLKYVLVTDTSFFSSWNFGELPFVATDECDYSTAETYASLQQERLSAIRSIHSNDVNEEDRDEEEYAGTRRNYDAAASSNEIPRGEFDTSLDFVFVKGMANGNPFYHMSCLSMLSQQDAMALVTVGWTRTCVATVVYSHGDFEEHRHSLFFLRPSIGGQTFSAAVSSELTERVIRSAEWILERKKESGYSKDFLLHSFRIAQSFGRDVIDVLAGQELVMLEQRETEAVLLRVVYQVEDIKTSIEALEKKKSDVKNKLQEYQLRLQSKLELQSAHFTDAERLVFAQKFRDDLEVAEQQTKRFCDDKDHQIAIKKGEIEELSRRQRLRETPETSWIFQLFDPALNGSLYMPHVRTALHSLETHQTAAMVAESLHRDGKQSRIQLFRVSGIPYLRAK